MAWPAVGISKVVSIRSVVVLPAPFGPSSPTISPGRTSKSMPRTASTGPALVLKLRVSPVAVIMRFPF